MPSSIRARCAAALAEDRSDVVPQLTLPGTLTDQYQPRSGPRHRTLTRAFIFRGWHWQRHDRTRVNAANMCASRDGGDRVRDTVEHPDNRCSGAPEAKAELVGVKGGRRETRPRDRRSRSQVVPARPGKPIGPRGVLTASRLDSATSDFRQGRMFSAYRAPNAISELADELAGIRARLRNQRTGPPDVSLS